MITAADLQELNQAVDNAQDDDTPFLAVGNDVAVIGDPNKDEKRNRDYKLLFGIPKEWKNRLGNAKVITETDYEYCVEVTFKNVFVPARNRTKVTTAFAGLFPFLKKVSPAGDVESFSAEEYIEIARSLNDEAVDAVYKALGTVFRLDPEIADCILLSSALNTIAKLFSDLPGIINESDLFTESSVREGKTKQRTQKTRD